jgi:hypothetical protein
MDRAKAAAPAKAPAIGTEVTIMLQDATIRGPNAMVGRPKGEAAPTKQPVSQEAAARAGHQSAGARAELPVNVVEIGQTVRGNKGRQSRGGSLTDCRPYPSLCSQKV